MPEFVSVGNSVAPAEGSHEAPDNVGFIGGRSQTGAASDPGTDIRVSNGEVAVPTPDRISGLPKFWASRAMANSQPGFTFNPTLHVAGMRERDLFRIGSPRRAGPGPPSQDSKWLYGPDPGAPLGQRNRPSVVAPGEGGFRGRIVRKGLALKILGPRRARPRAFPKLRSRRG